MSQPAVPSDPGRMGTYLRNCADPYARRSFRVPRASVVVGKAQKSHAAITERCDEGDERILSAPEDGPFELQLPAGSGLEAPGPACLPARYRRTVLHESPVSRAIVRTGWLCRCSVRISMPSSRVSLASLRHQDKAQR